MSYELSALSYELSALSGEAGSSQKDFSMETLSEQLARRWEAATETLWQIVEPCTESQWQTLCLPEERTVGVMVHHVASAALFVVGWAQQIGRGESLPPVTMEMVHAGNAAHAQEYAYCTKAETLQLLRQNSVEVSAVIRSLSDEQLARTAPMALFGGQPFSAQTVIEMVLIGHIHGYPHSHLPNIRTALAV